MKLKRIALLVALAILAGAAAMGEGYHISGDNEMNFGRLGIVLLRAYEKPSPDDEAAVETVLDAIGAMDARDREVAEAIAEHWMRVYVNADGSYRLYIHDGGERATALEGSAIPDASTHAFVVLGFELKNGEMTDELKGRCQAAAAAARAFPNAILICSGGATGPHNPQKHTEAGLMKDYLTRQCGIDASRIYIDEKARSTVENARNTFAIMRERGVSTYTLVTSTYHQKWSQVLYNAMAAFCHQSAGYDATLVENYCFDIAPDEAFRNDDRWAMRQLVVMLDLPDEVVEAMKRALQ